MEKKTVQIRLLKADEIECRAAAVNEKGVSLLLYKDARVDQKILDETFGIFGWQRKHQSIDGNMYCTVAVYDSESGVWVEKQDVGAAGYAEKEKSQASDSFKRACFNWGIGRELYTAPFIWIPAEKTEIQKKTDRYFCNDRFYVDTITYNDSREITGLTIKNGKGKCVYELKAGKKGAVQGNGLTEEQMASLQAELDRTGVSMADVQERYRITKPESMSEELYRRIMSALAKTKPMAA